MKEYGMFVAVDNGECSLTADETPETEPRYKHTGLYDYNGTPIYRVAEKVPMGFHYPNEK